MCLKFFFMQNNSNKNGDKYYNHKGWYEELKKKVKEENDYKYDENRYEQLKKKYGERRLYASNFKKQRTGNNLYEEYKKRFFGQINWKENEGFYKKYNKNLNKWERYEEYIPEFGDKKTEYTKRIEHGFLELANNQGFGGTGSAPTILFTKKAFSLQQNKNDAIQNLLKTANKTQTTDFQKSAKNEVSLLEQKKKSINNGEIKNLKKLKDILQKLKTTQRVAYTIKKGNSTKETTVFKVNYNERKPFYWIRTKKATTNKLKEYENDLLSMIGSDNEYIYKKINKQLSGCHKKINGILAGEYIDYMIGAVDRKIKQLDKDLSELNAKQSRIINDVLTPIAMAQQSNEEKKKHTNAKLNNLNSLKGKSAER